MRWRGKAAGLSVTRERAPPRGGAFFVSPNCRRCPLLPLPRRILRQALGGIGFAHGALGERTVGCQGGAAAGVGAGVGARW
jgi:hypothetical protein